MKGINSTFIAALLLLCSIKVYATPDESIWRTVSVLGANADHYYVLVAERTHPGSYYSYRERMLIEKHITKLNRKVFSEVISDIQYTNIDPEKDEWKSEAKAFRTFDLTSYIANEKITPLYPDSLDSDMRIVYLKDGLHLERKNKSILLRPLGKSLLNVGEELGVPGIYYKSGHMLLKVSQGELTIDQNYLEMVLPISKNIYRNVRKQLSDKKK